MANGGLVGILAEGSERVVLIGVVIEPAHCVIRREVKCGTVVQKLDNQKMEAVPP
jgi:hypothetical protein